MDLAFIGLGNMGHHMATNVLRAGHRLTVHDLRAEAAQDLIAAGAAWADSPRTAAAAAEAVLLSLPGPRDVEEVVAGPDGVLEALREGDAIIDLSTNAPSTVRSLADRAAKQGVGFLDAPVSGGTRGAREATLAVMVGGDPALFERFHDVFSAIGANVFHTGAVGTGNVAKLINNQLAFVSMMAMNEALAIGVKAGIDPVLLRRIVQASSGNSFAWDAGAAAVLKDRLPPRFTVTLACKDIGLAQQLAQENDVDTPMGRVAHDLLERYRAEGFAQEDILATIKAVEERSRAHVRGTWHD
jgi:3-hydroxyisobutyrate dehydrogenase